MKRLLLATLCVVFVFISPAALFAASLPQDHDYQRQLRSYLATLTEKDFEVELKGWQAERFVAGKSEDELYRLWMLTLSPPSIGGLALPPSQFTLRAIEGEKAVMRPAADACGLAWLAQWDNPGNPYHGSRAVKNRAFVLAAIDMIMTDAMNEESKSVDWTPYPMASSGIRKGRENHSDCLGGALIWVGYPYGIVKDALPANVRASCEAGLKKLVLRLNKWGPTSLMTDMDLFAPVGLWYVSRAMDDAEVKVIAESYSKKLYTNPRYFSPAGYFVDIQGFDASYNGISLYYATWAALATDWPFAREALSKAYRLKAHLYLPEPDGKTFFGPTHFSPRTSADSAHDQWNWPHRDPGAAMATDEALYLTKPLPSVEEMTGAVRNLVASFDAAPKAATDAGLHPWGEKHFISSLNFSHDYYVKGTYEKIAKLRKENSPLFKPPFMRGEVRSFATEFKIARFPDYGVVIHTGPVGEVEPDWPTRAYWMPREAPFGFSGGALSAFWTPKTGPVILGRRRGAQGSVPDKYEDWRIWPFHAVSGQTAEGRVFTSARILQPQVKSTTAAGLRESLIVWGEIPRSYTGYGECLKGTLKYKRAFAIGKDGVLIQTWVESDGQDKLAEMCETIPIFLGDGVPPTGPRPITIQFQVGDKWQDAGTEYQENVKAVKVTRYGGAIVITLDKPQRVKLSPQEWQDNYQSRATCRTILIDLLGKDPAAFKSASVSYTIAPLREP